MPTAEITPMQVLCGSDCFVLPFRFMDNRNKTATATDALSATVSPGRAAQGRVYFEVPASAKDIRIGCRVSILSEERAYLIVDGEQDAGFVPEKNTAPTEGALQPGGSFTAGGLEIRYLSCGEFTGEVYNRKAGCRYVQFALEVTNPTSEELRFSSLDLRACADGMCVQSDLAGSDTLTGKLAPGASASGEVVFTVPEDAQTVEAEYQQSYNGEITVLAYR